MSNHRGEDFGPVGHGAEHVGNVATHFHEVIVDMRHFIRYLGAVEA